MPEKITVEVHITWSQRRAFQTKYLHCSSMLCARTWRKRGCAGKGKEGKGREVVGVGNLYLRNNCKLWVIQCCLKVINLVVSVISVGLENDMTSFSPVFVFVLGFLSKHRQGNRRKSEASKVPSIVGQVDCRFLLKSHNVMKQNNNTRRRYVLKFPGVTLLLEN